jgi:hypothetical protein
MDGATLGPQGVARTCPRCSEGDHRYHVGSACSLSTCDCTAEYTPPAPAPAVPGTARRLPTRQLHDEVPDMWTGPSQGAQDFVDMVKAIGCGIPLIIFLVIVIWAVLKTAFS